MGSREARLRSRNAPPTRKRKRRVRFDKRFFIFLGLIVAAAILFFCLTFLSGGSGVSLARLDIPAGAQVTASSNSLFSLAGTTLTSMDLSGKPKWSVSFKSGDLTLTNSDTLICVYNESTANVLGTDQTAGLYINPTDFKIKSARCGVSCVAILTESTNAETGETAQYIRVFTSEGVEVDKEHITNGTVIAYDFYDDSDDLYYLTLDTKGVVQVSRFTTMSPSKQTLTGAIDITDNLITDVYFAGGYIYLSGTTNLAYYDAANMGEKAGDVLVYGLECVDTAMAGSKFVLLYVPRTDDDGVRSMRLISKDSVDTTMQLPESVIGVFVSPSKLYAFSKDYCYTYEHGGRFIEQTPTNLPVSAVEKISDKYLLVTGGDSYYLMAI